MNYGGSTGYGRAYRERLNGNWGIVDMTDCINAARYLADQGEVDGERLVIRGGSAGGYTTLCALTFHDDFAAGASYFGIADLEPFAKPGDTHKFESRYEHTLVGPYPEAAELYRARSPIHFVDLISCPMIVLQGSDDEVVPPAQAELMVEALKAKGLPYAYLLFEGEQHGFRKAENIVRSLEAELSFYAQILGFEPGRSDRAGDDREPLRGGSRGPDASPAPAPERGRNLSAPLTLSGPGERRWSSRWTLWERTRAAGERSGARNRKLGPHTGATARRDPVRIPRWLDAVRAPWHHGPASSRGGVA